MSQALSPLINPSPHLRRPVYTRRDAYYQRTTGWWPRQIYHRNNVRHKNVLLAGTGEFGEGKTWWVARTCERTQPDFEAFQVVYTPKQFYEADEEMPVDDLWRWIFWDDPTKGLSKTDHYTPMNKTVGKFIQTRLRQRKRNLAFAVPYFEILDLHVRTNIHYEGMMMREGLARVHRIRRNKYGDSPPVYKRFLSEVKQLKPKLWREIERRKDEFNRSAYGAGDFEEQQEAASDEKEWREVYRMVMEGKDEMGRPCDYLDPRTKKISAVVVGAMAGCSDQTARKALKRIEIETQNKQIYAEARNPV